MLIYGIIRLYYKIFESPLMQSMAERNSIMISKSLVRQLTSIPTTCKQCKGKCWVPNDPVATQKNAKAEFGIIPNPCVNGAYNSVHCPAALGLL